MYLYVFVLYFLMYFVCIACISQNVYVSMRLATFAAENTGKYMQYRQIQASYIHQFFQNTYKNTYKISQLLCACMCMYLHVFACIWSVFFACLYFLHPKTCMLYVYVFACICMYRVTVTVHPWVYVCSWATLSITCCRANEKGPFELKLCFIFQTAAAG